MVCSPLSHHSSTSNEQLPTKKARVAGSPCSIILQEVSITGCKNITSPKILRGTFFIFSKNWLAIFFKQFETFKTNSGQTRTILDLLENFVLRMLCNSCCLVEIDSTVLGTQLIG